MISILQCRKYLTSGSEGVTSTSVIRFVINFHSAWYYASGCCSSCISTAAFIAEAWRSCALLHQPILSQLPCLIPSDSGCQRRQLLWVLAETVDSDWQNHIVVSRLGLDVVIKLRLLVCINVVNESGYKFLSENCTYIYHSKFNSFPHRKLDETTGTSSYYMDENNSAGSEIQRP